MIGEQIPRREEDGELRRKATEHKNASKTSDEIGETRTFDWLHATWVKPQVRICN